MPSLPIALLCSSCGAPAAGDDPFRCIDAEELDEDHVIARVLDLKRVAFPRDPHPNPFIRYRSLLYAYHLGRGAGMTDADYVDRVEALDAKVKEIAGTGFAITPFERTPFLADTLGLDIELWVKDETRNVAGSHKARHLMGLAILFDVSKAIGRDLEDGQPWAIASCGNAALAAAVVARAAERELMVFVPTSAQAEILQTLRDLGASVVVCDRPADGGAGDPCTARMREEVADGAVPFTCQGPDNGLSIEGGITLAYEMAETLSVTGTQLDKFIVQVGGGALASGCLQGFFEAKGLGLLRKEPAAYAVQTEAAYPLARAYDRIAARVQGLPYPSGLNIGSAQLPQTAVTTAKYLRDQLDSPFSGRALRRAARHRSEFMWPWEEEPKSIATGILDDETYDWLAVVRAMMRTGGFPVVVSEETLVRAHALGNAALAHGGRRAALGTSVDHDGSRSAGAGRSTGALPKAASVPAGASWLRSPAGVSATGTAGLAGLLRLAEANVIKKGETVAVLFTGCEWPLAGDALGAKPQEAT